MAMFAELVASRQTWITRVLRPWCQQAAFKDLKLAEQEWLNLAGNVDPERTLWAWAWNRFPGLVNAELWKIDETHAVTVQLTNGQSFTGYPDGRRSRQGTLTLICHDPKNLRKFTDVGPFKLDEVAAITHTEL